MPMTVLFFLMYFVLSNLVLFNLFIATILEKLKKIHDKSEEEIVVSAAAQAAMVMKEAMEVEAAQKDLDNAREYFGLLQSSNAAPSELEAGYQLVQHMADVVAKELIEAKEAEDTLSFCGISSTHHSLGIFPPASLVRQCTQWLVHKKAFFWASAFTAAVACVVPCLKGQISNFDRIDELSTQIFGLMMLAELVLKSTADGFLWVFPTFKQQDTHGASVAPALSPMTIIIEKFTSTIRKVKGRITKRDRVAIWKANMHYGPGMHWQLFDKVQNWINNSSSKENFLARTEEHNWTATARLGHAQSNIQVKGAVDRWISKSQPHLHRAQAFSRSIAHTNIRVLLRHVTNNWMASYFEHKARSEIFGDFSCHQDKYQVSSSSPGAAFGAGSGANLVKVTPLVTKPSATASSNIRMPPSQLTAIKEYFQAADKDSDGDVSAQEYMEYMAQHGVKIDTWRPYLLTGWNVVELLVLCTYIIDMSTMRFLTLRYSWASRPLRLLSFTPSVQVVVICMLESAPALLNVLILGMCLYFVFAVMGLQVFMGAFYTCTDTRVAHKDQCIGFYTVSTSNFNNNLFEPLTPLTSLGLGNVLPRVWTVPPSNFDHIGTSFATLFKVGLLFSCCSQSADVSLHAVLPGGIPRRMDPHHVPGLLW